MTRNSFILFTDYQEQFEMLSKEQAGVLICAMLDYVAGKEVPEMEPLTKMAFIFIKRDVDATNGGKQRGTR